MAQLVKKGYVDRESRRLMRNEFNSVSTSMAFSGAEITEIFNGCVVNIVDEDSE